MNRKAVQEHNNNFLRQSEELRRQSEEQDRLLREDGERQRRGMPSREQEERQRQIEARNAETRKRQQEILNPQPQPNADDVRLQLAVRDAALAFMSRSDYHRSQRNFEMLTSYIDSAGLDPTQEASFHQAYKILKHDMERPSAAEPMHQPEPQILPPGAEQAPDGTVFSAEQIAAMSADEYAKAFQVRRAGQYRVTKSAFGFDSIAVD